MNEPLDAEARKWRDEAEQSIARSRAYKEAAEKKAESETRAAREVVQKKNAVKFMAAIRVFPAASALVNDAAYHSHRAGVFIVEVSDRFFDLSRDNRRIFANKLQV